MVIQNKTQQINEKHPNGLAVLFFTEMWERFSFYGMRALLILYLVKVLKFDDKQAGSIYGAYTGLVYLTPLLGGYVADRYIGYRKAILFGGILMAFGHLSLAINQINSFFIGLGLLILGNGFFKPNISTLLGRLYHNKIHLKDSGFTIFYMGINLGAFFGSWLCGLIGEKYSWHLGFGLAGFGMIIGLLIFRFGFHSLEEGGNITFLPEAQGIHKPLTKIETDRIWVIAILSAFGMFFWLAFEQAGSSISLFTDRFTDRNVFGYIIPASTIQSVNPFMILLLAPLFTKMWTYMAERNIEPITPIKFMYGFVFLGIGFGMLALGAMNIQNGTKASLLWIIFAYLFHTIGELFLSPVGLSMVTKLSPVRFGGFLMGFWFLSTAFSQFIAGVLSGEMSKFASISSFFLIFVITSFASAMILILLAKKLYSMMHGIH
ncbi:MAG: peptide MFS transporter [Leptospiraceae bacterium]|nr:peptide MFS transporter [Leptospiraceae bacterium]MCP5493367.1 peptide MFS transporter [Leptospiraceae bacterium]